MADKQRSDFDNFWPAKGKTFARLLCHASAYTILFINLCRLPRNTLFCSMHSHVVVHFKISRDDGFTTLAACISDHLLLLAAHRESGKFSISVRLACASCLDARRNKATGLIPPVKLTPDMAFHMPVAQSLPILRASFPEPIPRCLSLAVCSSSLSHRLCPVSACHLPADSLSQPLRKFSCRWPHASVEAV